uniref:Queuine tRNA-ribosyltransferase catalytic subunit 1 n=1 Tax=Tetradesmus obliquus TaxID=3088 RepID=A0A383VT87_TETOB|eukprot:jgi/Sobl393_1/13123/SZX68391.1
MLSRACRRGIVTMASAELPSSSSPALQFQVLAQQGRARTATMKLPHYTAETPMFMPVGTQGTVKGLTSEQMQELDCHVILGNTYHLGNRPGPELVAAMGGLHSFINWPRGMLTDSGGFQMVSLLHLADITEEGVTFQSPVDGSRMLLTPEESIGIQNDLGADIMMQLDDVVPATNTDLARFEEATHRTTRWLDRCIAANKRPHEQNLFPIVQGGFDVGLRQLSMQQLIARNAPGYAIGGLAGGEPKDMFWRVVAQCAAGLPPGKPRYVMGIGYPLDILVCSALGADMYDSVYPTRTARFGVALVDTGVMKLKNAAFAKDMRPIDESCSCMTCRQYTRSYLHHVVTRGVSSASILVTYHNVAYMQGLTRRIRQAIKEQRLPDFSRAFLAGMFPAGNVPQWVVDALDVAGISLEGVAKLKPAHSFYEEVQAVQRIPAV